MLSGNVLGQRWSWSFQSLSEGNSGQLADIYPLSAAAAAAVKIDL